MKNPPRVLIHGTGFAGQGHTDAFRFAGAEVVGMVGRTLSVVTQVSQDKGIPYFSCDWLDALESCKPDIVSIASPGGVHFEPIKQAINAGCHVFCDKPLTTDGESSKKLLALAQEAEIKTAFSSSFRYMPNILHAKKLIEAGAIGEPLEVECVSHFGLERNIPFGWSHRKEDGGGRLNNNFTHVLSMVTSVIGENILSIMGEVRDDLIQAPIVDGVHNFKTRREHIPKNINDPDLKWGKSNVEWSYTVLAQLASQYASRPVSVMFKHGGLHPHFDNNHIVFYGSEGAIYIKEHYASGPLFYYGSNQSWEELPLPDDIKRAMPNIEGDTERNWAYLAREFVHDIKGEVVQPYQTFTHGSQYQQLIDIIRENKSWTDVTHVI